MVAEQAFLAPRAPVEQAAQAVAVGTAVLAAAGEVGGVAFRACGRRVGGRFKEWSRFRAGQNLAPDDNVP